MYQQLIFTSAGEMNQENQIPPHISHCVFLCTLPLKTNPKPPAQMSLLNLPLPIRPFLQPPGTVWTSSVLQRLCAEGLPPAGGATGRGQKLGGGGWCIPRGCLLKSTSCPLSLSLSLLPNYHEVSSSAPLQLSTKESLPPLGLAAMQPASQG